MACEASVFVSEQSLGARQELLTLRPEIGREQKLTEAEMVRQVLAPSPLPQHR